MVTSSRLARGLGLLLLIAVTACRAPAPRESTPIPTPAPVAVAEPTATPPPEPTPTPIPPPAPAADQAAVQSPGAPAGRVRVANTEGQGANMRREPGPNAERVKSVREGTELESLGQAREVGGQPWRSVRDPADGSSGWIAAELLEDISEPEPVAAEARPGAEPPPGEPRARPDGEPSPPGASPGLAAAEAIPSSMQRIDDADRAYLASLRTEMDTLGKAIVLASQQMEAASARPAAFDDTGWRSSLDGATSSLSDAARDIRAAKPGPATGQVHQRALNAADRAQEAADLITAAADAKDARGFGPARTALLRTLSEINAMNGELLRLQ